MIEYDLRVDDSGLAGKLKEWGRRLPEFADTLINKLANAAMAHIQAHKLTGQVLNVRSGDLRGKMLVEKKQQGTAMIVAGGSDVPYAAIHETGGTILPKRGKYLRFQTQDGAWHTVSKVYIPPRPYFKPGVVEFFRSGEAGRIANAEFAAYKRRHW